MVKSGRPLKYARFLEELEDEEVYTPASIVRFGESRGCFGELEQNEEERRLARLKVRHTLARMSTNHEFPQDGDGWVYIRGQPPLRGWTGKRWKAAMYEDETAEGVQNELAVNC